MQVIVQDWWEVPKFSTSKERTCRCTDDRGRSPGCRYANEMINMVYGLRIHLTRNHIRGSSSARLSSFQNLNGTLNGDLAHYDARLQLRDCCRILRHAIQIMIQNMCYSDLDATYNNVPTYSWTVMVLYHEMVT